MSPLQYKWFNVISQPPSRGSSSKGRLPNQGSVSVTASGRFGTQTQPYINQLQTNQYNDHLYVSFQLEIEVDCSENGSSCILNYQIFPLLKLPFDENLHEIKFSSFVHSERSRYILFIQIFFSPIFSSYYFKVPDHQSKLLSTASEPVNNSTCGHFSFQGKLKAMSSS